MSRRRANSDFGTFCLVFGLWAIALLWPGGEVSAAGFDEASMARADAVAGGSARSQAEGWIVPPEPTFVVGGSLTVLTSKEELEPLLEVPELTQTDVVLLGLNTRYAWGKRVELYGAGTLLPKKPVQVDASVWQDATLGVLISLSKRDDPDAPPRPYDAKPPRPYDAKPRPKFAMWTQLDGGTLLGSLGHWSSAVVGGRYQQAIDDFVVLKATAGVNGTALWLDEFGFDPPRFAEVMVGGEIVLAESRVGALWLASQFYFPFIASAGGSNDELGTEYVLDPTTRANIHLGGAMSFIESWDIFVKISILDRGELARPETTLPILQGGFDQTTITVGLNHRWSFEDQEN